MVDQDVGTAIQCLLIFPIERGAPSSRLSWIPAAKLLTNCSSKSSKMHIGRPPTVSLSPGVFMFSPSQARTRLADALQTIYDQITPATEVRPEKRAKLGDNCLQAPAVVAIAAHSEPGGKISRLDELCSTACAVQNLLLSAHQRGLGSFWATPPVACSQEFTTWLGLDSTHCSLGLVFLGYAKDSPAPSIRVPWRNASPSTRLEFARLWPENGGDAFMISRDGRWQSALRGNARAS